MNLALALTDDELLELRRHTKVADNAAAVTRATREFLRICRGRELMSMSGKLEYDEHAWRELDRAELSQPAFHLDTEPPSHE